MYKKIITTLLVISLVITTCVPVYADSYNYTDKEFTITYDDDLTFNHHSDGTCDIVDKSGAVIKTMSKAETAEKFKALRITFDQYGSISVKNSFLEDNLYAIGVVLGAAGEYANVSTVTDYFKNYLCDKGSHTLAYAYATNTMQNATVSDNGTITLSSDAIKQIYSILDEYFPRPKLLSLDWDNSFKELSEKEFINAVYGEIGSWGNNSWEYTDNERVEFAKQLYNAIMSNGYDTIYFSAPSSGTCQVNCFHSSDYVYYSMSNSQFYDSDGYPCTVTGLQFNVVDYATADAGTGRVAFDLNHIMNLTPVNINLVSYGSHLYKRVNYGDDAGAVYYFKTVEDMNKYMTGDVKGYTTTSFDSGKLPATVSISPDDLGNISGLYDEMLKELEKSNDYDAVFEKYLHELTYRANSIDDTLNNGAVDWRLRNIIEWLEKINSTLNSGFTSMYSIKDDLKDIKKGIKDIGKDVAKLKTISEIDLFLNALNTLDSVSNKSKVSQSRDDLTKSYNKLIDNKFPFSTLKDLNYIFNAFSESPKVPEFKFDIKMPFLDFEYSITTDLSAFDKLAAMCRDFIIILYIIYLVNKTQKLFFNGKGVK